MPYPKDFHPTKDWVSPEYTISATGNTDIPVPQGFFIDRIVVTQGGTDLGSSAAMIITLPEDGNNTIVTCDADASVVYSPSLSATVAGSSATAGTAYPIQLYTNQGIRVVVGGTVASGGTATIKVYAQNYYPIWSAPPAQSPTKVWVSPEYTLTTVTANTGVTINIPVPKGYWIDRIYKAVGGTNFHASNTNIRAHLVEANNATVVTFDADAAGYYLPTMPYTGNNHTAVTSNVGRAIKMYTNGGINITSSGSGIPANSSGTFRVRATRYYPPRGVGNL